MKKYKYLLAGGILATALFAGAQEIDPITKAVLNTYTEMIAKNPKDYMSYYQRAEEYLGIGEVDKAKADLEDAIRNTPAKDTSFLEKEYALLCDVYIFKDDMDKAIETLQTGLKEAPTSYYNRFKLGNLYLALDRPEEAYNTFRQLQSLKSRSQEAYYGMGLAAAALGRTQEVEDLIQQVINANLNSYLTYQRAGEMYEAIGKNDKAATNYIRAYTMVETSNEPLESLVKLASKDYATVNSELQKILESVPSNVTMRYIKATIAEDNGDHATAISDLNALIAMNEGREPFVYSLLAKSQLNAGNIEAALEAINQAETLAPANTEIQSLKALILEQSSPQD